LNSGGAPKTHGRGPIGSEEVGMAVDLAPELLEILACPNCHGSLAGDQDRDELVCLGPDCGLAYPVRQGIPVLLIDEARRPDTP
jgi:uncharacterized protein YbaR (Trm112 family)